jgi:threonine/homoserine/homoserine lactone efflux protein
VLLVGLTFGGIAMKLDRCGWRRWVDRAAGVSLLGLGFFLLWRA